MIIAYFLQIVYLQIRKIQKRYLSCLTVFLHELIGLSHHHMAFIIEFVKLPENFNTTFEFLPFFSCIAVYVFNPLLIKSHSFRECLQFLRVFQKVSLDLEKILVILVFWLNLKVGFSTLELGF